MFRILFGVFVLLHGLVHLWYFVLSQGIVEFQAEMGWSGESWILSRLMAAPAGRSLAGGLYLLAAIIFAATSAGIFTGSAWWRPVLLSAAAFSLSVILLFWDGRLQLLVEKGLIGLLINAAILVVLLAFHWAPAGL